MARSTQDLNSAKSSASRETSDSRVSSSRSDVLALEVGQEVGVAAGKGARASEAVDLASVAEVRRADGVSRGARAGEELAGEAGGLDRSNDVLEDIALGDDLATGTNLESVAGVVVPVVVDDVEESVSTDLGGTAGGLVDVVVLEGDGLVEELASGRQERSKYTYISRASEVKAPVVVTIASSRPRGSTVDLVVGDGHSVAGTVAENNVLTADQGSSDVVDPDEVGVIQGNSIATPDVLRVEGSDVNVLNDDVLGTLGNVKALPLDNTLAADTNKTLVGSNDNRVQRSLVILDADLGGVGLVVVAPAVLVNSDLAGGSSTVRSATSLGGGTLSAGEVKGSVQDDDSSR